MLHIGKVYFHFQRCDPLLGKQYFLIKMILTSQISWSEIESLSERPFFHRIVLAILEGIGGLANLVFVELLKYIEM